MRLAVLAIGRLKDGPERDLCLRYQERSVAMARALGFSGPDMAELPESRAKRADDRKREEAAALSTKMSVGGIIILDERAKAITSEAFAAYLAAARDRGQSAMHFVIGGADGLEPELMARAERGISFGAMTLPHQLVRALVLEQIYRAMTICAGHPYHRA
ncbi:MAG: 23S rRNA (pseudouridine(1915)-N(3))-methyltransferase RlmH [Bosea sp. (in: a-proteobacteria)]